MTVTVEEYFGGRDREIAALVLSIQNGEAGLQLGMDDQPDLLDIAHSYQDGGFWIALDDSAVIVGTIGLLHYGRLGVLKKLFVAAPHRGVDGPSSKLLGCVLDRARELGMTTLVLDTPAVAARSHAFYAKNGFEPAQADEMPTGYEYPDRDSMLFRRRM